MLGGPFILGDARRSISRRQHETQNIDVPYCDNPVGGAGAAHTLFCAETQSQLPHYTVVDLGTLGGTFSGAEDDAPNQAGQVDGYSTLPGESVLHAFLWGRRGMSDLGTLGGPNSMAVWPLNNWGAVPVVSDTSIPDPECRRLLLLGHQFYLPRVHLV
jgi:probable HAF family extracellular repeat protein